MSVCDNHGDGQNGKICSVYVTVVKDGVRFTRRLKLCAECVNDVTATFGKQWSDGFVLTRFNAETACNSCGVVRGETGTLYPLYATGYNKRDQRFDYYASYCDLCANSVISHFRLQERGDHAA